MGGSLTERWITTVDFVIMKHLQPPTEVMSEATFFVRCSGFLVIVQRGLGPTWARLFFLQCPMPAITFSISIDIMTALLITAESQIIVIPSVLLIGQLKLSIIQEHRVLVVSGEGKRFYPCFRK